MPVCGRHETHQADIGQSDILGEVVAMRWLMIALLVSLGAMLIAAAGAARHIWLQRAKLRHHPSAAGEPVGETDPELEL